MILLGTQMLSVRLHIQERAQAAALELNNFEAAPERRMSVLISDPEHKKQRSDANAEACEVYVAGLSKFVEEKDLRRLFSPVGR